MPIHFIPRPVVVAHRADAPLRGRTVLTMLLGFFFVVASVNAIMMTFAIKTMPGVDVKSAYEASQRFNAEIARMKLQNDRHWTAQLHVGGEPRSQSIRLEVRDAHSSPVQGLAVTARFRHPATRAQDLTIDLIETSEGNYDGQASIGKGAWTIVLDAKESGAVVFTSHSRREIQ